MIKYKPTVNVFDLVRALNAENNTDIDAWDVIPDCQENDAYFSFWMNRSQEDIEDMNEGKKERIDAYYAVKAFLQKHLIAEADEVLFWVCW